MVIKFKKSLAVLMVAGAFVSCALPNMPVFLDEEVVEGATATVVANGFQEITITEPAIELQWDVPTTPIAKYKVYWREHGLKSWSLLGETEETYYLITQIDLHGKRLDFAVTSVDGENESDFHSSLDENAEPPTGWFIHWVP